MKNFNDHQPLIIGSQSSDITYADRPTVKVLIRKGDQVLIINKGLLPGGGVEEAETLEQAAARELQEELGMSVDSLEPIGIVHQYRDFLQKRYVVYGYAARLQSEDGSRSPQDDREASFRIRWMTVNAALAYVTSSISAKEAQPEASDRHQGKLFNLMTTKALLETLQGSRL